MSLLLVLYGAVSVVGLAGWAALRARARSGVGSHGRSRWARTRELALLYGGTRGRIVIGWRRGRLLSAPPEDNVLAFGVQRSGKTSTLVVPTLLEWRGALVATSTKDELVRLTGEVRARTGRALVFAPLDPDPSWVRALGVEAIGWNPLSEVRSRGLAAELADHLTAEGKESPSAHWYLSAANLLTGLFLVEHANGGDLSSVLRTLNVTAPRGYISIAVKAPAGAADILKGVGNTPDKEAGSIVSTARAALSLWLDERVEAATAASHPAPLDLDRVLAGGETLYLVAPAEEAERCRPLFSALLATLLRKATARARALGGVLDPRLLLALDEVANFARVPRLDSYVSTGPGQGIQTLLCFHDLAQLEAGYGQQRARTVWNNCRARLLLPGQGDPKTLEQFSKAIGDETVQFETHSRSSAGGSTSEARIGRPLSSPDDLRRSKDVLLVYANAPPVRLQPRRWDQVPAWREAVLAPRS